MVRAIEEYAKNINNINRAKNGRKVRKSHEKDGHKVEMYKFKHIQRVMAKVKKT